MDTRWIETIGQASGGDTEQGFSARTSGTFWQSAGSNASRVTYPARVAAGLHLGCGVTPGIVSAGALGEMRARGSGATLVITQEPITMTTAVEAGSFQACGLSIALEAIARHSWLDRLVAAHGSVCLDLGAIPSATIRHLSAPVDPWFQGAARRLVHEARALELMAMLEQTQSEVSLCASASPRRTTALGTMARDILDASFTSPPSLGALAGRLQCSRRTLTHAFRKTVGVSIGAYVTLRRLELAALMLRDGVGSTEVAYRVGYSPAHFASAFKRHFGVPPSRWRSLAQPHKHLPGTDSL
jgi:AraC family transcriptional activator of pyochelin receptor